MATSERKLWFHEATAGVIGYSVHLTVQTESRLPTAKVDISLLMQNEVETLARRLP